MFSTYIGSCMYWFKIIDVDGAFKQQKDLKIFYTFAKLLFGTVI